MGSEKPNFLSQPVVKNVFMYRNGDPYYDARRIVINQKRVSNFETLLREVTGGIQAPFGAVRNIYTPRGGHKVDCLESLQSGEQYVAAGRERFKKLDYLHIGSRKRRLLQTLPMQAKPLPQNRVIASARFLKPIKEPCTIFVVANGDVLNPAVRQLIHQRMLGQFDKILEMITERMGLKVLGGVRSLYTYEGQQVTDGHQLESGQLYVAVGREKFKKLPYSDLLFPKPRGTRRVNGMKANSLPPIYRFSKQNGNGKSTVPSSDSGGGDSKASLQGHNRNNKEHLSSIVREISQARLISLRKKRSGQSMTLTISDNDDQDLKGDDGNTDDKTPQDQSAEPAEEGVKTEDEKDEQAGEQEETAAENTNGDEEEENQETNGDKEDGEEKKESESANEEKESEVTENKENKEQSNEKEEEVMEKMEEANKDKEGEGTAGPEEKDEEIKEVKEVTDENKEGVKSEEQGSSSSTNDKSQDSIEKEDGSHTSSEGEKDEQLTNSDGEKRDKDGEKGEKSRKDQNNDVDTGEEQTKRENGNDPGKTQPDNETKDNDNDRSNSSNSNQEKDGRNTKEGATKESGEGERKENGEVGGEDDEEESEAEPDMEGKKSTELKDTATNGEKGGEGNGDGRKRKD
ncbi:doublecortin domain-containing protein 2 [Solea senegalensis]|uniref:Doublecortin domain-containing protein 2 n=1 Tax=Solea senegalensis TaxID=28829 RepID=A0AAV6PU78_SOLSE|nr:doublecortin domain-containing protein 2-like [Solea senegalensis]KAG7474940.1 doublecortin domain-containing protein 2 [Solea senegalensis]